MPKQLKIMLSDSAWAAAQAVPSDERQALVEAAITKAMQGISSLEDRRTAASEMDRLRNSLEPVEGSSEDWIREQRDCP